jgi:hypothetical protein
MSEWYRDPIWQFIAVIVNLFFGLTTIFMSKNAKRKRFSVRSWLNRLFGKRSRGHASKPKCRGRPSSH